MTNNKLRKNRKNKGWTNIIPGHGRNKGSKNKFTTLKQAFLNAFNRIGGEDALVEWAQKTERNKALFFQMITKLLPQDVEHGGKIDTNLNIKVIHINGNNSE